MSNIAPGLSPQQLLAGPRGRRLLLEFAVESEREALQDTSPLGSAVFDASYRLAKLDGQAVFRFGWGPGANNPGNIPDARPEHVAALLTEASLAEPTPELIRTCLASSVGAAMYWQPPDGGDLLAAAPAVREALARVAEHVAHSRALAWLSAPPARDDQWRLRWLDAKRRPAREPRAVLTRWLAAKMATEQQCRVHRSTSPDDELSGLWWSRPPRDLPTTYGLLPDGTPSGLLFVEDTAGWTEADARRVVVAEPARIYEIDGPEEWAELCRAHPLDVTATMRDDWGRTTGRRGRWVIPDWARVAKRYDAARLSYAGYLSSAGVPIPVDDETASLIAGWDPDATFWFIDVEDVGRPVRWRCRGEVEEGNWARHYVV
ncbi:MAG TPA: hypothetical protein PKE40_03555 [Arachnia sp.]|nr:hypothetical protein [Arachnia sp.]HMT85406.1 hypothetical protein [Arachnia sp.]